MEWKQIWGVMNEPLVDVNGHITPIFVGNSHERQFSIIPTANNYKFFYQEMPFLYCIVEFFAFRETEIHT